MPEVSYPCSDCGERIEDTNCPVVVYIVAGLAPIHPMTKAGAGQADVTDYPLPQIVRDLLAQPVARQEYCAGCFAKKMGHPLVDANGKVVAKPANAEAYLKAYVRQPDKTLDAFTFQ